MPESNVQQRLSLYGWLSYDLANTIFSMNILTMYFAQWVIIDLGCPDIYYSAAYSISMIAVAITLPIFGRRSDHRASKKSYLVLFTLTCIACTAVLGMAVFVTADAIALAVIGLICLIFANYFYEGGLVFYNALLYSVSNKSNVGTISGLGTGIGYVGSILGLLLVQPFVESGFLYLPSGRQSAFLPTAILFMLTFIPTWIFLKEKAVPGVNYKASSAKQELKELWDDLKEARTHKGAFRFLIANYFFVDAISTLIIFMAVYAGKVMGMPDSEKVTLFIVSTISAVIGSFASGRLSDYIGYHKTLKLVVLGWVAILIAASVVVDRSWFWVLGSFVGIFLGSTWTVARPLLNSLVPETKLGLFYGLYSLSGKAAAVIGPLLWGGVVLLCTSDSAPARFAIAALESVGISVPDSVLQTIEYRFALLSLTVMMIAGFAIFVKVPDRFRKASVTG
jgi:UMF1 family MFS transporter